ncbi:MAG: hypothetical protein RL148_339 [Planctomycetota bacterium]
MRCPGGCHVVWPGRACSYGGVAMQRPHQFESMCPWVVLVAVCASCAGPGSFGGPLPVRNQHPAQLQVMQMLPAGAATLPAGGTLARVGTSWTSMFLGYDDGAGNSFLMDGEILEVRPEARIGLSEGLQLGVEVPVAHTSGGVMDSFLIDWHDFWGMPDQDRDSSPRDAWDVYATRGGTEVYRMDAEPLELMDVPWTLTLGLVDPAQGGFGLAVRGGVELPTGDVDRGFGSGSLDASAGVLLEQRFDCVRVHGWTQYTAAGVDGTTGNAPDGEDVFEDVAHAGLGAEWMLAGGLAAVGQVTWETSTLRDLGFERVARDQVLLWVGGRFWLGSGWQAEAAFCEDLNGYVSPDFSVYAGVVWTPGRKAAP